MKITCDAKRFVLGCTIAKSLGLKTTLPVTSLLLIEATGSKAVLKATNLEAHIIFDLKAEVEEEGQCFVNPNFAQRFARAEKGQIGLRTIGKQDVELSNVGGDGSIKTKLINIGKFDPVSLPKLNDPPLIKRVLTNIQRPFSYALQCVDVVDLTRPFLTGVLLGFQKDNLTLVSADGFRLIKVKVAMENEPEQQVIIPATAIRLIAEYMKGDILFISDKDRAWFETDDLTIITQTIQGTYPQYASLIPDNLPNWTIECSAPLLAQRLSQMSSEAPGIIRLTQQDNMLRATSRMEDLEETEAFIPASIVGKGKIAVNRQYLLEGLAIFSEMKIESAAPSNPLKITGDLEGITLVIMPIFVQWKED